MTREQTDFRQIVEAHQSMVFSIALRIVGERSAAEEVAQDAFLELHAALGRMESDDHIRFWLRRVTVNRATDCLRRRAIWPEYKAEEFQEELQQRFRAERGGANRGTAGAEVKLELMVSSLPEALRSPIVLRYQEDLDPDEIAKVLNQPLATVKSNLQRGLGLLRRKANVMLKEFIRD
jgi:RNA polymerase sigma-70 factor (ECF subfamily)